MTFISCLLQFYNVEKLIGIEQIASASPRVFISILVFYTTTFTPTFCQGLTQAQDTRQLIIDLLTITHTKNNIVVVISTEDVSIVIPAPS